MQDLAARTDRTELRVLVVSHGGGPDAEQRRQLTLTLGLAVAPTAVMTSSSLMRGISAALSFFNRQLKVVDLNDTDRAFSHLGLSALERTRAHQLRSELEAELQIGEPPTSRRRR